MSVQYARGTDQTLYRGKEKLDREACKACRRQEKADTAKPTPKAASDRGTDPQTDGVGRYHSSTKNGILCKIDGGYLWTDHDKTPKNEMGKLLCKGKSEF